ncbi:MAG: DUF3943 domain-containing protein [Deltaproteobacteria bacterium]|nr:DUF3943 domain-containing protein [Deltaproteobacteria bacterium]
MSALALALAAALTATPDVPSAVQEALVDADSTTHLTLTLDPPAQYVATPRPKRLRAAAEIGTFLALDWSLMLFTPPPVADPPGNVSVWTKLSLKGVTFDVSAFATNFGLHPLGGTLYYGTARSNHVSAFEAFAWVTAASTLWELAEYPENFSINDELVTPVAGAALGETMYQLASRLDRGPQSLPSTVLSWVLAPMKKIDDALDGIEPERGPPDGQLEVHQRIATGAARGASGWSPDVQLALDTRLIRDVMYGHPGHELRLELDGGATELSLSAASSRLGLEDFQLGARAWFATLYHRDLGVGLDGALHGHDVLLGAGPGYAVRLHDWSDAIRRPLDTYTAVHIPGVFGEVRSFMGPLVLSARLDAALSFGGTRSLVLDRDASAVPYDTLPTPQRAWGYYFGIGPTFAPTLAARLGPATLAATAHYDAFNGIMSRDVWPGRHPSAQLSDSLSGAGARLSWLLPWANLELTALAERLVRSGVADGTSMTAAETRVSLGLGMLTF